MNYISHPADGAHRGGTRPRGPYVIVMHATGGTNSLAWLSTTPGSQVSSHLLIKKDRTIYRIVEDTGVAWHAGVSSWGRFGGPGQLSVNDISIGIELENLNDGLDPYPLAQIEAASAAVYEMYRRWGHLPVVSHQSIAPTRKTDPAGFDWGYFHASLTYRMTHGITWP